MKASRTLAVALAALVVSAGLAGVVAANDERNRTAEHEPTDRVDRALDALAERYDLTDEQVAELEALVLEMRANGASVTEIREAVRERLVAFGVPEGDLPGTDRPDRRGGDGRLAWMVEYLDLTDEQVTELRETVRETRADGAYPAEVRVAVLEQLRAYGYTDAELVEARDAYRIHRLETAVSELREAGAMEVEVRAAVLGELQAFGVIPEEYPRDGRDDHRHRHAGHGHVHSYPHGHGDGNAHENGWSPADATA